MRLEVHRVGPAPIAAPLSALRLPSLHHFGGHVARRTERVAQGIDVHCKTEGMIGLSAPAPYIPVEVAPVIELTRCDAGRVIGGSGLKQSLETEEVTLGLLVNEHRPAQELDLDDATPLERSRL